VLAIAGRVGVPPRGEQQRLAGEGPEQVKVALAGVVHAGEQAVDDAGDEARVHDQCGDSGSGDELAALGGAALERAHDGGAGRDDAAAAGAGAGDRGDRGGGELMAIAGLEVERVLLPPGAGMTGIPHTPGTREYLTCERGEVELSESGRLWRLAAGDVVVFRGDQSHGYRNPGREPAIALAPIRG